MIWPHPTVNPTCSVLIRRRGRDGVKGGVVRCNPGGMLGSRIYQFVSSQTGITCIAEPSGRHWQVCYRRPERHLYGSRGSWSRSSQRSTAGCAPTWMRRRSNDTRRTSSYGDSSSSCTDSSGTAGRHEGARQRHLSTKRCARQQGTSAAEGRDNGRDRRPPHLLRPDHRNRHHQLPPRPRPRHQEDIAARPTPLNPPGARSNRHHGANSS